MWRARRSPFAGSVTTNARRLPSGENCTSEMVRRFKESSGVNSLGALALGGSCPKMGVARVERTSSAPAERERFIDSSFTRWKEVCNRVSSGGQLGLNRSHYAKRRATTRSFEIATLQKARLQSSAYSFAERD